MRETSPIFCSLGCSKFLPQNSIFHYTEFLLPKRNVLRRTNYCPAARIQRRSHSRIIRGRLIRRLLTEIAVPELAFVVEPDMDGAALLRLRIESGIAKQIEGDTHQATRLEQRFFEPIRFEVVTPSSPPKGIRLRPPSEPLVRCHATPSRVSLLGSSHTQQALQPAGLVQQAAPKNSQKQRATNGERNQEFLLLQGLRLSFTNCVAITETTPAAASLPARVSRRGSARRGASGFFVSG